MALDYENFYKDRVYKVAQLAPCTVTEPSMYAVFNMATVNAINAMDIYDVAGPNWYKNVEKLRGVIGRKGVSGIIASGWGTILNEISVKAFYHYAQNAKQDRFQRYSDSYWTPFGKKETDLFDLTLIDSTPFGFFFGANDTECPVA